MAGCGWFEDVRGESILFLRRPQPMLRTGALPRLPVAGHLCSLTDFLGSHFRRKICIALAYRYYQCRLVSLSIFVTAIVGAGLM
jgi:hypothetical protein